MQSDVVKRGLSELRSVRSRSRGLYWAVALFSLFANLLMLTGPLYMLQVYDRVLGSGSEETLIALSVLVVFLYGVMGVLDYTRGRIMARVGARFQSDLDRRVFDAVVRKSAIPICRSRRYTPCRPPSTHAPSPTQMPHTNQPLPSRSPAYI